MATILIVDDHPTNRLLLTNLLGYGGHRLLEAADGDTALTLIQSEHPDLVITDILMPAMDGFELVHRLRSEPSTAPISVIFYTASYLVDEAQALAERLGVHHILIKPSEPENILQTVNAALGGAPTPQSHIATQEFRQQHLKVVSGKLAQEVEVAIPRLTAIIELGQQLAWERDPQRLIENFCNGARTIIGAQYAAVALVSQDMRTVERLFTSGVEANAISEIGGLPTGHGFLKRLFEGNKPIRVDDLSTDPIARGFPAHHPHMHSFLGVPLLSPTQRYGWLYLTEKLDMPAFTEEDEQVLTTLAAQAAIAYENVRRYYTLQNEIVRRQQLETELRVSEARYRAIVEDQTEMICRFLPDGTLTFVNEAYSRAMGRAGAELIDHNFMPMILQEDFEAWVKGLASLTDKQPTAEVEFRITRPDGGIYWQQWTYRGLFDEQGYFIEFQGVGRDITVQKQIELQRLELAVERERVKMLHHLIQDVSHDLRTPLTIMKTSLYLLDKPIDPEKRMRRIMTLNQQIDRLQSILESLLTLARLDSDAVEFRLNPCDLKMLLQETCDKFQSQASEKQPAIQFALADNLPFAAADWDKLQQAVKQMLTNAFNYTPETGTITISACQRDQNILVEIRDTGIGISTEDLPFVFDRFYRVDKARNSSTGGSGLGLTICKKIIDRHGGRIWVESKLGEGSSFYFTLPIN